MHRWDLGAALGRDLGYPAELAVDGVDEVVTMFFPRQVRLRRIPPLTPVAGRRRSTTARPGCCAATALARSTGPPTPTVTGPADALVLLLWGRLPLDDPRLTVTGSARRGRAVLSRGHRALTPNRPPVGGVCRCEHDNRSGGDGSDRSRPAACRLYAAAPPPLRPPDRQCAGPSLADRAVHTATPLADGSVLVAGGCDIDGCGRATASTFLLTPRRSAGRPRR